MLINTKSKHKVFKSLFEYLNEINLEVKSSDRHRPWGGFLTFAEADAAQFLNHFYSQDELTIEDFPRQAALSPKLLVIEPGKRLSWQYHSRRAEVWKCIFGTFDAVVSDTDEEKDSRTLRKGDIIKLAQGQRHRIVGKDCFAIIAEIWQHTDPNLLSNEDDIVRLQDDYGRN